MRPVDAYAAEAQEALRDADGLNTEGGPSSFWFRLAVSAVHALVYGLLAVASAIQDQGVHDPRNAR